MHFNFDEIITGFRFSLGGAQATGVTPDLATFAKAVNAVPDYMSELKKAFFFHLWWRLY